MTLLTDEANYRLSDVARERGDINVAQPLPKKRSRMAWTGHGLVTEGGLVFLLSYALYQIVAWLLDWKVLAFQGDAISRMANGFYVIHSRDPHLAAVGFVWAPLSSAAVLPLLVFNGVWPALASHDVAGTTVSALAMAGAVYQLNSMLREWGVQRPPRLVLTLFFAASPMIVLFGGNGMSEALYLFTMLATARYLSRWLRDNDLKSLVFGAIALGVAYLERSEPVASAILATLLVLWVTFSRASGNRRARIWSCLTDATIFVIPILTSFVAWAVISFVITGQPFQQFTSKYGNAALIANAHVKKSALFTAIHHEAQGIAYLAPALPLILLAAIAVSVYRRNTQIWVIAATLGGGLGFTMFTYLIGSIFPWYRYYILVVPIEVLLVATMFSVPTTIKLPRESKGHGMPEGFDAPTRLHKKRGAATALVATAISVALLAPSIPGSLRGMDNPTYAPDITVFYGFIFHRHPNSQDHDAKVAYAAVERLATAIDRMQLPNGQIIIDNSQDCVPALITNVQDPRVFVIPNDRDYQRTLDDPLTFRAHYLMTQVGSATDSVSLQYPDLAKASWVKLVRGFPADGLCAAFELYKVTSHPQGSF